jgi:hypothetical protein
MVEIEHRYPNTHVHDHSLSWRGISIKSGGVKLIV